MNSHDAQATFSQKNSRQARLSLKPQKTCGQGQSSLPIGIGQLLSTHE